MITYDQVYSIKKGDVIEHPVFGPLKVVLICRDDEDVHFEVWCELQEFNNTLRPFDAMDLTRIKFKRKTIMKLVKD